LRFDFFGQKFFLTFRYIKKNKNKKMRHIKLFENFGANPIITATGDFSKLTKDGSPLIGPNLTLIW